MQEGQDQDFDNDSVVQPEFSSDNIGSRATTEYFSNVKGGKKNKEKVTNKRTRFTRKTLSIILGVVIATAVVFAVIFAAINIGNRHIGERTREELPTNMIEVQRRAYRAANVTGRYYDGIVYLKNLILDMEDSNVSYDLIFETYVYMARFISEAGEPTAAIDLLKGLEDQGSLTDLQKYWLYSGLIDIYRNENNDSEVAKYQDLFNKLNINENFITFDMPVGGSNEK